LALGGYSVVYDGVVGPWLLDPFGAATGLDQLHYVVLLPPEHVCVERVRSRVGHGFRDLDAARLMYGEFAGAQIDERHLVSSLEPAETLASAIHETLLTGRFTRTIVGADRPPWG
jgi:hypothetical protein